MNETIQEKVAQLLNEATLCSKDIQRISYLKQVQELILKKEPDILDNFLEEILQFQLDKSSEIRKFIVSFIEESCKSDPEVIVKVIDNFRFLLFDENVNVQKRSYLAMITILKNTLRWISKLNNIDDYILHTWDNLISMKKHIISQLDSENDGIRTATIKFIETLIIISSKDVSSLNDETTIIENAPENHKIIKKSEFRNENLYLIEKLLDYTVSPHISSVNLISCLGAISNIARHRTQFLPNVLKVFEKLKNNLPPTLSKSQLDSVKKQMKLQLISILKNPYSTQSSKITDILIELGMNPHEILRITPKTNIFENRKRVTTLPNESELNFKKLKLSNEYFDSIRNTNKSKLDLIIEDLAIKLNNQENIVDLVFLSMVRLPDNMPSTFKTTYKPVAAAGTHVQKSQLAKLIADQLTEAELDLYYRHHIVQFNYENINSKNIHKNNLQNDEFQKNISSFRKTNDLEQIDETEKKKNFLSSNFSYVRNTKSFKLSDVTELTNKKKIYDLMTNTFNRMHTNHELPDLLKKNFLFNFAFLHKDLIDYICKNIRKRTEIGMIWMFHCYLDNKFLYNKENSMSKPIKINEIKSLEKIETYRFFLQHMFSNLKQHDPRDLILSKVLYEVPLLTAENLSFIKSYCSDETRTYVGIATLKELILRRPGYKEELLRILLELTCYNNSEIRNNSIRTIRKLHELIAFRNTIESFALGRLKCLVSLKSNNTSNTDVPEEWTEENIKPFLYLYLDLMPLNHSLLYPLSQVYSGAPPEIKRTILRSLERPIIEIGMESNEILKLVEECPKGSETLVTRIIHILTEKSTPTNNLVQKVRDLYRKRISDVRFLIPVLNYLPKEEIIETLPNIIKLSQSVVKEVFSRLLMNNPSLKPSISPVELLVALHKIEHSICDLKTIINATSLCFAEKNIYTQDIFARVIDELSDINPIPTLFMRTVIQALSIYPKLSGYIVNILQKLIQKQIWQYPKVWEGFIKCCQRTKPASYNLLFQLPKQQFQDVLIQNTDLKESLKLFIANNDINKSTNIPNFINEVFEKLEKNIDEDA